MKRLVLLLVVIASPGIIIAQTIQSGGYGCFMTGPALFLETNITDYLKEPELLGPSYSPSPVAIQLGGEGFAVINRFLLGGAGYSFSGFESTSDSASVDISSGGGYFETGYIFYFKGNTFMTANIGFGGFGYSVDINNIRDEDGIPFNEAFPVRTNEIRNYSFGGTSFDICYGLKHVVTKNVEGELSGFMIGFDAGCLIDIPTGDWNGDEENVIGPPSPGVLAFPYIRLTIGGGGLKLGN